ncbi:MAG: hypothetical protein DI582_04425 [Azospirillum brasilense]|nr:MAG: hypothetical protein DI582_04425 [Azospirillum brasilense]
MQTHASYHSTYQRLQYRPVIQDLRLMAKFLQQNYSKHGLTYEVHNLRGLESQLDYLLGYKSAAVDFVTAVAGGKSLFVGEGNLSFALSLAKRPKVLPQQMTVTIHESKEDLSDLAHENAKVLTGLGARVLYGIDATKLHAVFSHQLFSTVIFQFPHTGTRDAIRGRTANFVLIKGFLESARQILARRGQVIISTVDNPHYRGSFQFFEAAEKTGFMPPTIHRFDPNAFPGYEHTMTNEEGSALSEHDQFSTWVFRVDE